MPFTAFRETETKGRKSGRMSVSERHALDTILPMVRLSPDSLINKREIFGREAPVFLEIGFGCGTFLSEKALNTPENDFIGVEIYKPGIAKLLKTLVNSEDPENLHINNVRIFNHNARHVLMDNIPYNYLDGAYILFPDPWPKTRHHKRRLIDPDFTTLLSSRLKPEGFVIVGTDHQEYAREIEHAFDSAGFTIDAKGVPDALKTAFALKALKKKRVIKTYKFIRQ